MEAMAVKAIAFLHFVINNKTMRNSLFLLLALLILSFASCGKPVEPKPEEVAGRAAKAFYDYLIQGKYDAYVDAFYRPDSIPASYREQLIVSAKQYVWQMKTDHQGLQSVEIAGAKADTARHIGSAFLVLGFKDKTKEEIVVPLVLNNGNWMMR